MAFKDLELVYIPLHDAKEKKDTLYVDILNHRANMVRIERFYNELDQKYLKLKDAGAVCHPTPKADMQVDALREALRVSQDANDAMTKRNMSLANENAILMENLTDARSSRTLWKVVAVIGAIISLVSAYLLKY